MTQARKAVIIFVLSLALLIIVLDSSLLNVSLSTIIKAFHTNIQSLQWVITAYSLTLAALTITGGRIGDLFGRKRMFVLGAIIFACGSFITSISQNIPVMIAGESIIEGIGAALMMPATASLLVTNFTGKERRLAFGIWGGVAGAASALGPVVGGFLSTDYSWRWGFRINIFVALILCLGSLLIPESQDTKEKPTIDVTGVILSSIGLLSFIFGVIESEQYGWFKANAIFSLGSQLIQFPGGLSIVPFALTIGIIFIAAFIIWELHMMKVEKIPLVSMKLFLNKQFTSGVLTTLVLALGQSGIIFSLPIFFQAVRMYTPLQTGIALLPMPLTLLVVSPLASALADKINYKYLIQAGLIINVLAMLVLRESISTSATAFSMIPGLILMGLGMGLVFSQINNVTLSAVPVQEAGEASGVNNTFRQVGASFGSAILGAVLIGVLATNLTAGIAQSSVIPQNLKGEMNQLLATQSSNIEFGGGAQITAPIPAAIKNEIITISHEATVDANRQALLVASIFAFLGFLISFFIPKAKHIDHLSTKPQEQAQPLGESLLVESNLNS